MPNVHRLPTRSFRPDPPESYTHVKEFLATAGTGLTMDELVGAAIRWIDHDPAAALVVLAPHLRAPAGGQ